MADSSASSKPWYDRYKVPIDSTNQQDNAVTAVYDFRAVTSVPADVWVHAQQAEAAELAARPQAIKQAEQAKYRRITNMPEYKLNDGNKLPAIGLGTWKADRGQVRSAVHYALQAGYRHIDCASVYQNEEEVGDALGYVIKKGLVSRKELYICSKVWNNDHAADRVRAACLRSLKALQLDYLDLYLIHWPVTGNVGSQVQPSIKETWQAMELLVKQGLVKSIGVSNFSIKKLQEILTYATIKPAVCQVEVHPYHRNDALIAWCRKHDIHVTAYSPLGSPDSASIFNRDAPLLMDDPVVKSIATKTGKDVGQVLIRWAIQHGTSVLPKSVNPKRIKSNADVWSWSLTDDDYAKLCGLVYQQRMVDAAFLLSPEGPYRTYQDFWDEEPPTNKAVVGGSVQKESTVESSKATTTSGGSVLGKFKGSMKNLFSTAPGPTSSSSKH